MLSVDHDHETGEVRGLLCFSCNVGIGAFKEEAALVEAAVYYLHQSRQSRQSQASQYSGTLGQIP
jgi:hypothetical protein